MTVLSPSHTLLLVLIQKGKFVISNSNLPGQVINLGLERFLIDVWSVVQKVLLLYAQIEGTLEASGAASHHVAIRQGQGLLNVRLVLVEQILDAEA